jgi:hypothetical protein
VQQVPLDHKDRLAAMVQQVVQDLLVYVVVLDLRAHKVFQAHRVVLQDPLVQLGQQVLLDQQVLQVILEVQDQQALLVYKDQQAHRVQLA